MRILQIGQPKSGNYWLYTILKTILNAGGVEQKSYIQNDPIYPIAQGWELSYQDQAEIDVLDIEPQGCYYRISSIYRMPVQSLDDYLDQTTHVWSHSYKNAQSPDVLSRFDRIIYIIRDPRDRAISAAKFYFTPYAKFLKPHSDPDPESWLRNHFHSLFPRWVEHVGGYLELSRGLDIHVVFYERLLSNLDVELSALSSYLGVNLSNEQLRSVKDAVSFQTMKEENPQHVRKGQSNRWASEFTGKQKMSSRYYAGAMMKYLGYPLSDRDLPGAFPVMPDDVDGGAVQRMVRTADIKLKVARAIRVSTGLI